jgi:hypothetical protein
MIMMFMRALQGISRAILKQAHITSALKITLKNWSENNQLY